jgi:hypothetical protein
MTTLGSLYSLDIVRNDAVDVRYAENEVKRMKAQRDRSVRFCYSAGNATLAELARATGLSKQRIHVIVREGAE